MSIDLNELEKVIKRHFRIWDISSKLYLMCIEEIGKIDLESVNEIDVERIIGTFLIMWGQMARVLKKNWERELANVLRKIAAKLDNVKKLDLIISDNELNGFVDDIRYCYDEIRDVIGPTSTSKVLHIISPRFFPLWDSKIRKMEMYKIYNPDGKGYIKFMLKIRELWFKDNETIKKLYELKTRYGISELRLIDIYNWNKSREK